MKPLAVTQKLAGNRYVTDATSHIRVNQALARATGTGRRLIAVCPARVYSEEADGTIAVEHAACLECGACLAVAAPGALEWHYPRGGRGVSYREG